MRSDVAEVVLDDLDGGPVDLADLHLFGQEPAGLVAELNELCVVPQRAARTPLLPRDLFQVNF